MTDTGAEVTDLTQESLEKVLLDIAFMVNSQDETFVIRPKHLIVPPAIFCIMMYRTPIKMARGVRGRKRALYWRSKPIMWKLLKEKNA
jgi:hypothetical protein